MSDTQVQISNKTIAYPLRGYLNHPIKWISLTALARKTASILITGSSANGIGNQGLAEQTAQLFDRLGETLQTEYTENSGNSECSVVLATIGHEAHSDKAENHHRPGRGLRDRRHRDIIERRAKGGWKAGIS
jgi:hypothetical protein